MTARLSVGGLFAPDSEASLLFSLSRGPGTQTLPGAAISELDFLSRPWCAARRLFPLAPVFNSLDCVHGLTLLYLDVVLHERRQLVLLPYSHVRNDDVNQWHRVERYPIVPVYLRTGIDIKSVQSNGKSIGIWFFNRSSNDEELEFFGAVALFGALSLRLEGLGINSPAC